MLNFPNNPYQTIPLSSGITIQGIFPTDQWFSKMKQHVSFKDKTLLDLGSCYSSYGIQAFQLGALSYVGIEEEKFKTDWAYQLLQEENKSKNCIFINTKIEEYIDAGNKLPKCDIAIFGMIMHWLRSSKLEPEEYVKQIIEESIKETAIFVFRHKQVDFPEAGFHPTIQDLDLLIGKQHSHFEFLSATKEQNIGLAIYNV